MLKLDIEKFRLVYKTYYPDLTDEEVERRYMMFLEILPFIHFLFGFRAKQEMNEIPQIQTVDQQFLLSAAMDRKTIKDKMSVVEVKF